MRISTKNPTFWLTLFFLPLAAAYAASGQLIHEVEELRNSLSAQDPTRPTLTLRLADLLFDEVGNLSRGREPSPDEQAQIAKLRSRAVTAYEDALSGAHGTFKPLSGNLKLKVQFQLARLYSDMNRSEEALSLWKELVSQNEATELKREASLRLAEIAERDRDFTTSEQYYRQAIGLCNGTDLCSYAHYRRAWMMKNQGRLEDAVTEIQPALWDSKGQLREEALRDFIAFLGERASDGKSETALIESLIAKTHRVELLSDLSASFFSAGNRVAGVYVLSLVESRQPSLKGRVRLLEEYYGLKRWDDFHSTLEVLRGVASAGNSDGDAESEKVLKRLTVQLDGERTSQPRFIPDFEAAVELHLALFPGHADTFKMMEGWLAAEPDADIRSKTISRWLGNPAFQLSSAAQIELREARVALAQKKKDEPTVIEEMLALSRIATDPVKKREYRYVYGRSLYEMKRYAESLPVFLELAALVPDGRTKPDPWAVQSQNLALDIYAQQKDFGSLTRQASAWTDSPALKTAAQGDPALRKELDDMGKIAESARFQKAAAGGESLASLKEFLDFCKSRKLLPQSCDNAKVLSLRLKNERSLLDVLQAQGASGELAAEYEAAGYFAESAALLEQRMTSLKNELKDELKDELKVALLYELGGKTGDRDRTLGHVVVLMQKQKSYGELENLLFVTLKDASMLKPQLLTLAWTTETQARIVESLGGEDPATLNHRTREILLGSTTSTGPKWEATVLAELDLLLEKERKIQFYGARSQQKFAARLEALKRVEKFAEKYLSGASADNRARMLSRLQNANSELAEVLLKTPIPEAIQGEQARQIQESLAQMALPFQDKTKAYGELLQKEAASDKIAVLQAAPVLRMPADRREVELAVGALHENPGDEGALSRLRDYYTATKMERLAAYFKGRILELENRARGKGSS